MKRLFIVINCAVVAIAAMVLVPAFALADAPSSYTSFGYATGVHGIAGSDAFPNFQNGAVNNRYPMAEVQQDASPSSAAKATYSDSGPAAATVGSQYNQSCSTSGNQPPPPQICDNPNNQVPYATATNPGPSHGHIDTCNGCGSGPYADATANPMDAAASGYYSGGGTQPFSGAYGQTNTVMDSGGKLTVTTHSAVDSFTFGTVQVSKVVVDINAFSTLSGGGGDAHVTAGQVTNNGQPVAVNDQGVTIVDQHPVPCPSAPQAPVPVQAPPPPSPPSTGLLPPLPVGGSSGTTSGTTTTRPSTSSGCTPVVNLTYITIFTVAPTRTVDGGHVTIWATGLHIKITQPSPGPGVPSQSAEYVLGEGFADLQTGNGAAFGLGGFGGFGGGFGAGDFGGFGDTSGAGGPGAGSPVAQLGTALAANRIPLAFMFLTLEALLLASAAAWVWARSTPADAVPDEVLTP
ncbi:MAG TPA: hypothetical protein VFK22_00715 [Candidatus Dormibacteraeota bacterium]|nr:hypothetical protein [Candidatus Dormibacteraeota bacterium]